MTHTDYSVFTLQNSIVLCCCACSLLSHSWKKMQPTHSSCFPQHYSLNPWQHYTACIPKAGKTSCLNDTYLLGLQCIIMWCLYLRSSPRELAQVSSLLQRHLLIWCLSGCRPPMTYIRPFRASILCFICFFTRRFLALSSEGCRC